MADFIMTLSSDDEGPATAAPSRSSAGAASKKKAAAKLSRKEQLAQKKGAKQQKKQKRKRFDDVSDEEDESEVDAGAGSDAGEKMASDFVFDGLGGGFVGDKRNNVWVRLNSLQLAQLLQKPIERFLLGFRRMEERATSPSVPTPS